MIATWLAVSLACPPETRAEPVTPDVGEFYPVSISVTCDTTFTVAGGTARELRTTGCPGAFQIAVAEAVSTWSFAAGPSHEHTESFTFQVSPARDPERFRVEVAPLGIDVTVEDIPPLLTHNHIPQLPAHLIDSSRSSRKEQARLRWYLGVESVPCRMAVIVNARGRVEDTVNVSCPPHRYQLMQRYLKRSRIQNWDGTRLYEIRSTATLLGVILQRDNSESTAE